MADRTVGKSWNKENQESSHSLGRPEEKGNNAAPFLWGAIVSERPSLPGRAFLLPAIPNKSSSRIRPQVCDDKAVSQFRFWPRKTTHVSSRRGLVRTSFVRLERASNFPTLRIQYMLQKNSLSCSPLGLSVREAGSASPSPLRGEGRGKHSSPIPAQRSASLRGITRGITATTITHPRESRSLPAWARAW